MAFGLENLTDTQRKALMFGVPVVGAIVLGSKLKGGKSTPAPATPTVPAPIGTMPSTNAIGAGQLSDFESSLTDALNQYGQRVSDLEKAGSPTTATTPTVPSDAQFIADAKAYVTYLYTSIANRPPDPGGLNFWVGRLLAGESRQQVALEFSNEIAKVLH